jgi:hypothetical protein
MPHQLREVFMQIKFFSVMVNNQDDALRFYTSVLGFKKMADIPMGQFRWLTVISPDGIEGVELVLESMSFPPAKVYQKARFEAAGYRLLLLSLTIFMLNTVVSKNLASFFTASRRIWA